MADSRILRILLVEDDLQDELLLSEAVIEIEENRQWCNWRTAVILPVADLSEAIDCLQRDQFDVVLLNLSLPDTPALLDTFIEVHANAPDTPIIVLADEPDENLANRLLREGAQDVLIKTELECAPLARAIRYAVERQRRAIALRASAFMDDLTGVLSREAFLNTAAHYAQLSARAHVELLLASIEVTPDGRDSREPLLMQGAEVLRTSFEAPSVIGRTDRARLSVITAGLTHTTVEAILNRAAASIDGNVRFSVAPFNAGETVEDVLSNQLRSHAKTAILAD